MRRVFLILAFALPLMAACQLALPGRDRPTEEANPITGGTITTTTLEEAPVAAPVTEEQAADKPPATPKTDPAQTTETAPPDTPAQTEAAPAIPAALKSASQIACEKDDGTWARAGAGGGMACIRQTRDGGKQCDSKSDCQGECLARSRTCAPIRPMFGCNAVLMDNGAEVSLCID
jgi:hypothetical protein